MSKWKLFITDPVMPLEFASDEEIKRQAKTLGLDIDLSHASESTEEAMIAEGTDADAVIHWRNPITRGYLEKLSKCRLVIKTGIGVELIDVDAATEHGVRIANVPNYCVEEVADHTIALFLAVSRRLCSRDSVMKQGGWRNHAANDFTPRLSTTVFGILGFGNIARRVAVRAKPFVREVWAYDPFLPDSVFAEMGVRRIMDPEEMWGKVDFLSLNLPVTPETKHIINRQVLAKMKHTAVIINTSRGAVISEDELCDALEFGTIGGAGLDVFEQEPLPAGSRLRKLDNVVLTAHQAAHSDLAIPELMQTVLDQVFHALKDEPIGGWLNKQAMDKRAESLRK